MVATRNRWPAIFSVVGVAAVLFLVFHWRLPMLRHPLWSWFGISATLGLLIGRWWALALALFPAGVALILWLALMTIARSSDPAQARGDFGPDIAFAAPIIGVILAFIGVWGLLTGLAVRGAFRSVMGL